MTTPIIAIDGPAASGKGTLCRSLAEKLSFDLLDTGLLYRAVAVHCLKAGLSLDEEPQIASFVNNLQHIDTSSNLTLLRSEEIGGWASKISRYPSVRQYLYDFQREFGRSPPSGRGAILDGRDIGTVIFPETPYKIYLSAPAEIRAQRRYAEMHPNDDGDFAAILADVECRDTHDQNRAIAPLRPADEAFILDSGNLDPQKVLAQSLDFLYQRGLNQH